MRLLALTLTAATAVLAANKKAGCYDGLYMIVARGSNEPAGTGVTGNVTALIADRIRDSNVLGLDYPATFDNYIPSEEKGAAAMKAAVIAYHAKCPEGKMALFGYSQVRFASQGRVSKDSVRRWFLCSLC